jgi:UDP-MurNAc hydroxylase
VRPELRTNAASQLTDCGQTFFRSPDRRQFMQITSNSLTFINHASVLIKGNGKALLTDPWYEGESFHKGWKLIHENEDSDIRRLLDQTSHIWISHEHPDHFAIGFYKKFKTEIIDRQIAIIFQETKDKRVLGFLKKEGFTTHEVSNNEPFELEDKFLIRVIKDEFYDSALLCRVSGVTIFNSNDCPIHSAERIEAFKRQHGTCDILLTQFSYAAWKGGRQNREWRATAAREKLRTFFDQATIFEAKLAIPFASYVWFSNELNFYLNDSANTPNAVIAHCKAHRSQFTCLVMRPFESIDLNQPYPPQDSSSLEFWEGRYGSLDGRDCETYTQSMNLHSLKPLFEAYCDRLQKRNSWSLVRLIGKLKLLGAFTPIPIQLLDTGEVVLIDIPNKSIVKSNLNPEIALHSESLAFIFRNAFGFDTLTVNGTFEELQRGGFTHLTKNFAIENMNNLGYSLTPALFFNFKLISIFAARLSRVAKKLK